MEVVEQQVQCPVCTLYLHEGMSLSAHLDTHPKDQVISALCALAKPPASCASRCSTPYGSERSYRSRSRTPCDRRHRHRHAPTPYRASSKSRDSTEGGSSCKTESFAPPATRFLATPLPSAPTASVHPDQLYFLPQTPVQREFKTFARNNNEFNFNKQCENDGLTITPFQQAKINVPVQSSSCLYSKAVTPSLPEERRDVTYVAKDNVAPSLHYMAQNKPVHFVVPVTQSFTHNVRKNVVISADMTTHSLAGHSSKNVLRPVYPNQFATSTTIDPILTTKPTTMMATDSQIVYKELVHEVSGKKIVSAVPIVKSREDISVQPNMMYQNLLVFNPYSNTLYSQQSTHNNLNKDLYSEHQMYSSLPNVMCNKVPSDLTVESEQVSKESSLLGDQNLDCLDVETNNSTDNVHCALDNQMEIEIKDSLVMDQGDSNNVVESSSKSRVKILSNIKVELPIQSIPEIIDLTSNSDNQQKQTSQIERPNLSEDEAILPDFVDVDLCPSYSQNKFCSREFSTSELNSCNETVNMNSTSVSISCNSEIQPIAVNTFSVIKNIGNPNLYKDSCSQHADGSKSNDSSILPDLTCNEKPSISPCSDLTNDSNDAIDIVDNSLCTLTVTPSTSAKPQPIFQNRFPLSSSLPVTKSIARKNLFERKPKKILSIKTTKKIVQDNAKPSSSSKSYSSDDSKTRHSYEGNSNLEKPSDLVTDEMNRLDGFFKEIDRNKQKCSETLAESSKENSKDGNQESFNTSIEDDSRSCDVDLKEHSMDIEPECSSGTFNNDFRNCLTEKEDFSDCKLEKEDGLKVNNDDCTSGVERLIDNFSQKTFADLETMRSVNVIAFGSMLSSASIVENQSTAAYTEGSKSTIECNGSSKQKQEFENLMRDSYMHENNYAEYFNAHKEQFSSKSVYDRKEDNIEKMEMASMENVPKDGVDIINWETNQNFTNFIDCNYGQVIYQRIDSKDKDAEGSSNQNDFSADMCGNDHNDYVELICPRDNYLDHKGSFLDSMSSNAGCGVGATVSEVEALNIRTDERMPPRGELSEQESSGDVDTPWAGMYCDVVGGSTSYDLLARETWPSDGSDMEMPISPIKSTYNDNEDIPIVVGVKPPERNYRCATCGKTFNCPKERRVHRTKEHSSLSSAASCPSKKATKSKRITPLLKTIPIKKETVKMEPTSVSKPDDLEGTVDPSSVDIKLGDESFEDTKPKMELVKEEIKKKKREHICNTCKKEFLSEPELNIHLKIHPLECLTCGKNFYRRANLSLHIKRHLGIKNYRCDICEKRFITKQKMVEHYHIHTGTAPIKCTLCDETFRRYSNMVQHRNRHHYRIKKRVRDYVCHCGEVYHSKKKLAWHKEIHEDRPKACLYCSEKFVHLASLTRHMRRAHNNLYIPNDKKKTENVQCPICDHVYLKTSINTHLRTHTGSKPHSCMICNKSFTTKWNLKLHKWTHANRSSKPFKCALCKGAFVRHSDYISHMNSHKSVRPYTCNYCGCQFIRKYHCQRHVKEHENDKKYVCQVPDCGKTFHRSYYLSEHMRVHSGHRPFACNICGKTSSTKSNHNKHIKIHHAREPVTTEG